MARDLHEYRIEVSKDGKISYLDIHAFTRTQAAAEAKKAGYEVRSVNMTG